MIAGYEYVLFPAISSTIESAISPSHDPRERPGGGYSFHSVTHCGRVRGQCLDRKQMPMSRLCECHYTHVKGYYQSGYKVLGLIHCPVKHLVSHERIRFGPHANYRILSDEEIDTLLTSVLENHRKKMRAVPT